MLFLIPSSAFATKSIFVATNGSDIKGNGSIDSPYQTIQHAINESNHGDEILVRNGVYYELLTIENKFTDSKQFITIRPYQNEKVVLDGAKRDQNESKQAAFSIRNSNYLKISGFEIRNITTDDDDFYPAGILIQGFGNHIYLTDNIIHDIANNHIKGNAHGILVYGNSPNPIENIVIQNNRLHDLTLGSSESLTLSGNVTNFLIDKNTLYNNNNIGIDVAGYYNACSEKGCTDFARYGTISNNKVTRHSSKNNPAYKGDDSAAGIYVDGGAHIKVLNNYVENNNYGISIGSENTSSATTNIIIQNNTIKRNDKAGLVIGGSKSSSNGGASNIEVKNNKFFANDTKKQGYYEITLQQNIKNLSLTGNTYRMCRYSHHINDTSNPKISFTQNKESFLFSFASCKLY
ncbi:right-handed parallel beta-helix repeat-containing protein [Solibacillus sp. MA9]|uniref:Right-handed parallel beta-helix repeat-containing protein n=1 Tax=Solibacillus palustris TaxID=2908203 RepID=A0ABS9U9Q7_9BACL|nr:right-handed parallel beta-helix repeat-containing protein [Solibacillus sp. MA9]MCH7321061.1 right-handed parallel beta-helix repeat-containing protein [Solibacillus sp. MA9]